MGIESIFIFLLIGAVAGWLAGLLMKGAGFGLLGNIVVGIVGAFVAGLILPAIGLTMGGGIVGSIISATIGAVILLLIIRLVKRS
ncbi:MAG: GlsB/YeaQ/YmgE family stress response membrane protein [Planctomycetales bacterium]